MRRSRSRKSLPDVSVTRAQAVTQQRPPAPHALLSLWAQLWPLLPTRRRRDRGSQKWPGHTLLVTTSGHRAQPRGQWPPALLSEEPRDPASVHSRVSSANQLCPWGFLISKTMLFA